MNEQLKTEFASLENEAINSEAEEAANLSAEQMPGQTSDGPQTKEMLLPVLSLACDVLAPNWKIQDAEKQALSESYAEVLDKYFPDIGNSFGVELNALLITAAIFAPRITTPRTIETAPEPEPEQKQEAA